jgi:hypothetical protein
MTIHRSQERNAPGVLGPVRRWLRAAVVVGFVAGAVVISVGCRTRGGETIDHPGPVRPAGTAPPEADPARTSVVLVTKTPIAAGQNVVWCATIQLAWDALATANGHGGNLRLGPPASPQTVDALNCGAFPLTDLDAASFAVAAGTVEGGVVERFRKQLARMPGASFPFTIPDPRPDDVAAFAYLRKDLPFRDPFHVHRMPLAFAGAPRRVVSFGLDPTAEGGTASKIARQAIYHPSIDEFAVELLPREDEDRIVLASIPHPATLEDGWTAAARLAASPGEPMFAGAELVIPKIDFATTRSFSEIVGARLIDLPDPPGYVMKAAMQRNEFTLSELGARLVSAVLLVSASCSAPPPRRELHVVFDRPFLLGMIRTGATRPYFLAWFGNDDLFVRQP